MNKMREIKKAAMKNGSVSLSSIEKIEAEASHQRSEFDKLPRSNETRKLLAKLMFSHKDDE